MIPFIKNNLHKDICRVPEVHACVLNLYLNGEEYPHKVNDYFPTSAVDNPELLATMKRHMDDEDKHVLIYRKLINKLDQPIIELPMDDVYNHVIKNYTPVSFHILDDDSADIKTEKLASFMAHLHFLELRITTSLQFHGEACQHSPIDYSEKAVSLVLADEKTHVEYTKNAVFDLLPRQRALEMLAIHREAEHKANLQFSYQQLRKLVTIYSHKFPKSRRWIYKLSSSLLEWNLKRG
ncbi:MAG: hypothetical protein L3J24_07545 [Xanthomonadales bacterium]|nr:hypothetical protein [Xanthomonadales bacterium]